MKKAALYGPGNIRLEEVDEPKPGPNEVKIRIKYCGICGSDLHEYQHGPFLESPFGHETCGEIVEVGPAVKSLRIGDKVIAFYKDGFAEYMVCPEERLMRMPQNMTWKRAAVVEPLSGAAYALERGEVQPGQTALIAGGGPVGLMILLGLKAIGAQKIFLTEISETRRKKAEELGATSVFNPLEVKTSAKVKELTSGQGVDVAISVGIESTLKDCLASIRYRGKVIVQGIFIDRVPLNMLGFVTRETTMIGTNYIHPSLAMDWIESKGIQPESIITKIIPLAQITPEGFDVLTRTTKEEIKILVEPS